MSQKIVLNRRPHTFSRLTESDAIWLHKKGYKDLAEELKKNDFDVAEKLRTHAGLVDLVETQPETSSYIDRFTVVEIPDDVDWFLGGKSGQEKIIEEHRTWP